MNDKAKIVEQPRYDLTDLETGDLFGLLLLRGWKIVLTSCTCGGRYAWLKPNDYDTGFIMVGCICHTDPANLIADAK